jgi:hypothetical protein
MLRNRIETIHLTGIVPDDWLSDWALQSLKIYVTFSKDWRGGQFTKNLGVTLPTNVEAKEGKRSHVDVQARCRSLTVHEKVPVEYLDPVRPAGVGDTVVIVYGPGVGGVYLVKGVRGEWFDLAYAADSSVPLDTRHRTALAALFTR